MGKPHSKFNMQFTPFLQIKQNKQNKLIPKETITQRNHTYQIPDGCKLPTWHSKQQLLRVINARPNRTTTITLFQKEKD